MTVGAVDYGLVEAVNVATFGSVLTVAAADGATVLHVADTSEFDPAGGQVRVGDGGDAGPDNGGICEYIAISDPGVADPMVTLAAPLETPSTVPVGATVLAVSRFNDTQIEVSVSAMTRCELGTDLEPGELVDVLVPAHLAGSVVPEATVRIEEREPNRWWVTDVLHGPIGGSGTVVVNPGGGTPGPTFYLPETHGAKGDGFTDDRLAIQTAIDAATDAGGGVVLLTKKYAWKGDIFHKTGVTVMGTGSSAFTTAEAGLIALDGTSRYRYGQLAGHPYPGPLLNLQIKGEAVGGATQLLRVEAVNGAIRDVFVFEGVGDGITLANAQNCSLDHVESGGFPTGAAIRLRNNDNTSQGAGGNKIINSYFHTANKLIHVDNHADASAWPHDNMFFGCLFEQYQAVCHSIGHLTEGETFFQSCVFTGSAGFTTVAAQAAFLIENPRLTAFPTMATFESCYFGGGGVGVPHLIRGNSYGLTPNLITIGGSRTNVANASQGYFLCDDRAGGGLGNIFRVWSAIDGISSAGVQLATGINGGSAGALQVEQRGPLRFRMDGVVGNPLQFRRIDDTTNRGTVSRDFTHVWFNGTDSVQRGSIGFNGIGLSIDGDTLMQVAAYTTAGRPSAVTFARRMIYDTDLKRPLWSDGAVWHDALGTLKGSAALDFGSIAAGTTAELTITVTGAATGQRVDLAPPATLEAGLIAMGRVTAANTVTVRLANVTAAAIDPASATWGATVLP